MSGYTNNVTFKLQKQYLENVSIQKLPVPNVGIFRTPDSEPFYQVDKVYTQGSGFCKLPWP